MALWVVTKEVKVPYLSGSPLDKHIIDSIFDNLSEAQTASSATDLTLRGGTSGYEDDKLAGVRQHWYWVSDDTPGIQDPLTADERTAQNRFDFGLEKLQEIEAQPISVWNDDQRITNYKRRAEMIVDALNTPGNLTDNAKWNIIRVELNIDPRFWFWVHDKSAWNGYENQRGATDRTWYSTIGTGATPNSLGGDDLDDIDFTQYAGSLAKFAG